MTMITINVKEKRVVVVNAGMHWTKQWIHSDPYYSIKVMFAKIHGHGKRRSLDVWY